jgi:hypothetical protein
MKNIILTAVILILVGVSSTFGYLYSDTSNQLNSANTQKMSLQSQLNTANSQVTSLQSQVTSANAQVTSLQSQLSSIQSKYPAKAFPDKATLQNWINLNIGLIEKAASDDGYWNDVVAVQTKALEDGWIVNAYIYLSSDYYYYYGLEAIVGSNKVYSISIGNNPGNIVEFYS